MHELSIADGIVERCVAHADGTQVLRVRLEIGRLSCVTAEALQFCFEVCAKDTVVEGAILEIIPIPGRVRCVGCGAEVEIESFTARCTCGGGEFQVIAGEELRLKDMEVA
jgi:hydrogenase nickel incorporation protein HypA/HybF